MLVPQCTRICAEIRVQLLYSTTTVQGGGPQFRPSINLATLAVSAAQAAAGHVTSRRKALTTFKTNQVFRRRPGLGSCTTLRVCLALPSARTQSTSNRALHVFRCNTPCRSMQGKLPSGSQRLERVDQQALKQILPCVDVGAALPRLTLFDITDNILCPPIHYNHHRRTK